MSLNDTLKKLATLEGLTPKTPKSTLVGVLGVPCSRCGRKFLPQGASQADGGRAPGAGLLGVLAVPSCGCGAKFRGQGTPHSWRDHEGWERRCNPTRTASKRRAAVKAWVEAAGGTLSDGAVHLPHELPHGPARVALVKAVVGMRLQVVWLPPRQGDLGLRPKRPPPGG